ncbi:MAG: hypothetical protein R2844_24190 [Caldilineales bacterium]
MSRTAALAWFLLKDLARSLGIIAPLGLTLALYWIFFEWPGDVDYFAATGGFTLTVATLVTVLLLASQLNRSSAAVTLMRLPRRSDLLAAMVVCVAVLAALLAVLYTTLAVLQAKVAIAPVELLLIAPRWLALTLFAASLGLMLTRLTSRGGSYLITFVALALFATVVELRGVLLRSSFAWLAEAVAAIASPVTKALQAPAKPPSGAAYLSSLAGTLLFAAALFSLAAWLFRRKDLLWSE